MAQYRLGAVSYLNTIPLVYAFEQRPRADIAWTMAVPSVLVDRLQAGDLDAALISSIACLQNPDLIILPGTGIVSRGAADSVRLFCKEDPRRLRLVALDDSSRASAALARILLAECFRAYPEYVNMPPDLSAMLSSADAALLIGDPAMRAVYGPSPLPAGVQALDLGELWLGLTGLPFVFAVWAARQGAGMVHLAALLAEAREEGRAHLDAIADAASARLEIPAGVCRHYLRDIMRYELGHEEWEGLRRFRELAIRHGLIPNDAPPL